MTPERKLEVNRLLAGIDGHETHQRINCACGIDYTADLNALARLEEKLPPHEIRIYTAVGWGYAVSYRFVEVEEGWRESPECCATEAEARAEVIYQYLESKKPTPEAGVQ